MVKYGEATSKDCPKGGYVWLTKFGRRYVVPTTCKTWSCNGCRDRVKAVVLARIESGILRAGSCFLITVTLRLAQGKGIRDAAFVAVAWRKLLRLLKLRSKNLCWMRVIEVTKQGQPHLHLVAGGLNGQKSSCETHPHPYGLAWLHHCKSSDVCIEHEWARLWYAITGDSFVVHAVPVLGAAGAAAYLGKYLVKTMLHRDKLLALGFKRRWSRSRNWPTGEVHLRGSELGWETVEFSWKGGAFHNQAEALAVACEGSYLLEQLGDDVVSGLQERGLKRSKAKGFRRLLDESYRKKDESAERPQRD